MPENYPTYSLDRNEMSHHGGMKQMPCTFHQNYSLYGRTWRPEHSHLHYHLHYKWYFRHLDKATDHYHNLYVPQRQSNILSYKIHTLQLNQNGDLTNYCCRGASFLMCSSEYDSLNFESVLF